MDKFKQLMAEAKAKAQEALKAAENGEIERYEELLAESEEAEKKANAIKAASDKLGSLSKPVLPATLPDDTPPTLPPQNNGKNDAAKAVYSIRYGAPDEAIKAVLVDLHGQDYETKRWAP